MEDNTHHNLWECDMVLMSSTCRKLKQLIFSFIGAKTTITNCDLIEETSIRDNAGFTLVILNLNARRLKKLFKDFRKRLTVEENQEFQLISQRYVLACDVVRSKAIQAIGNGRNRRSRTLKLKGHLLRPGQRTGQRQTGGKRKNLKKSNTKAQSSGSEKAKNNKNFQEQLVLICCNPGVLISEMSMYTGRPEGPEGRRYRKTVEHRGGVARTSELPQVNTILRVHVTALDKDIVSNFKTYTCWCTLRDLRDMLKVYNFISHPDLLKHTNFKETEKLVPFSILTTQTTNNRPVAIKMIKQTAIDISHCVYLQ